MSSTREQLRERIKINKNDLDSELVNQADYYYQAGMDHATKASRLAYLDEEGERLRAVLDKKIRLESADDEKKPTETQIKSRIDSTSKWQEHIKLYLEAKQEAAESLALKEAYSQRSYALKDLVQLHLAQYYSSDTAYDNDHNVEVARARKEMKKAIKSKK